VDPKPAKETLTVHEGTDTSANLPVGASEAGPEPYGEPCRPRSACGSECLRRARCGKTARRDLCGGCRVTGSPTALAGAKSTTWLRPGSRCGSHGSLRLCIEVLVISTQRPERSQRAYEPSNQKKRSTKLHELTLRHFVFSSCDFVDRICQNLAQEQEPADLYPRDRTMA